MVGADIARQIHAPDHLIAAALAWPRRPTHIRRMGLQRLFCLVVAMAGVAAAPAAAQPWLDLDAHRAVEAAAEARMARDREIALQNEITSLETRLATDEAARRIEQQSRRPVLPPAVVRPAPADPAADTGGYVDIPADRLAASRERARAASENRR